MTQEEKAQRYEEALEIAKELISRCIDSRDRKTIVYRIDDIEKIFPEIKESEDKEIRKALINYFSYEDGSSHALDNITFKQILAWLEKQGEQKPVEWNEEDEQIILSIEQVMNCASLLNIAPDKIDKIRTWLKSLKYRVQPQQELSKKDEKKDASIEKACNAYCKVCGHYPRCKLTHICRQECDYFKDFQIYIKGK